MKRMFGISVVVLAILVLVAGSVVLYRLAQFRSSVAKLKADGQPVSVSDLTQTTADEGQKATHLLNRLAAPLSSFEKEMWVDEEVLDRPVDEDMIARFTELQDAYPDVIPLIDQLSEETAIAMDLDGNPETFLESMMQRMQQLRSCTRVLAWKIRILTAQGKADEAAATGLQIFRLCRLFEQHPMIVAQLVVNACRGIGIEAVYQVISNYPVSFGTREDLNRELELQDSMHGYAQCLVGERAFGIDRISELGVVQMAISGKTYLDMVGNEINNSARQPYEQQQVLGSDNPERTSGLASLLVPALDQIKMATARTRSKLRSLRIINALQAQPDAQTKTISQAYLVEIGVPQRMTVDTMNGEPMKIKREDNRWIVYSVGPDLEDDGGNPDSLEDYVVGVDQKK